MLDVVVDTIKDGIKLLPFLFFAFLIIEYIEHKLSKKNKNIIIKSGKYGPIIGSILGIIPQCGFSVMTTNMYVTRIISLGTLISIYLSTSDEMLPILLSQNVDIKIILKILLIKVFIGMTLGIIIDIIYKKQIKETYDICTNDHCECEKGILKSSLHHTLHIFIYILLMSFIINIIFEYVGNDFLSKILLKNNALASFITCIIGLIPNCGSSVILTQLYLNDAISFGSLLSGLLTNSGVALLVLFKINKNYKENFNILSIVYIVGVISGILIDLIG